MTIEELVRKYSLSDAHRHAIETLVSIGHTVEEFDRKFTEANSDDDWEPFGEYCDGRLHPERAAARPGARKTP